MKQIALVLKSENVAQLILYSPHPAQPGVPLFIERLFSGAGSSLDSHPSQPADLTSLRKALLGIP